jgi:hypothetical protein
MPVDARRHASGELGRGMRAHAHGGRMKASVQDQIQRMGPCRLQSETYSESLDRNGSAWGPGSISDLMLNLAVTVVLVTFRPALRGQPGTGPGISAARLRAERTPSQRDLGD